MAPASTPDRQNPDIRRPFVQRDYEAIPSFINRSRQYYQGHPDLFLIKPRPSAQGFRIDAITIQAYFGNKNREKNLPHCLRLWLTFKGKTVHYVVKCLYQVDTTCKIAFTLLMLKE